MRLANLEELRRCREELALHRKAIPAEVRICCGTGCRARGSQAVADAIEEACARAGIPAAIKRTGCQGFCEGAPLVHVQPLDLLYVHVKPGDAEEITNETLAAGKKIDRLVYRDRASKRSFPHPSDLPFYSAQTRVACRRTGTIDPLLLDDALAAGAYLGLEKVLEGCSPEQVLREIELAGLRGRGGAGFSTARKWRACREALGDRKYVLCNGDEGDPGAFKDNAIMEGDPHAVLEGMMIGAYAIGAREGIIYVRDEYPVAVRNLTRAIADAGERGLLGANILGTGFSFDLSLTRGGGAFVCGESSALMRSIEGKCGEPRVKYVHATSRGVFDCPTALNNVETWAHAGAILEHGGQWFAQWGTERSKGTKAFSLVGKVKHTGLIELPLGMPLRRIVFEIGGGVRGKRAFKALQTGGPSGGCVPESLLDLPVDYEELTRAGSMMGSGGMIVMDDHTCMVDVARYFVRFLVDESCGKCTPCREGLRQMALLLDQIVAGDGTPRHLEQIERLARTMQLASLCELGKSAPNPVLSTLRHFRREYETHVRERTCPAGVCRQLVTFDIDKERCNGCHACVALCPTFALSGERQGAHTIRADSCTACGACREVCPKDAIIARRRLPAAERMAC